MDQYTYLWKEYKTVSDCSPEGNARGTESKSDAGLFNVKQMDQRGDDNTWNSHVVDCDGDELGIVQMYHCDFPANADDCLKAVDTIGLKRKYQHKTLLCNK